MCLMLYLLYLTNQLFKAMFTAFMTRLEIVQQLHNHVHVVLFGKGAD